MTRIAFAFVTVLPVFGLAAIAQERANKKEAAAGPTKATYLITGLHCPPCTKTVESSLRNVKGVHSVKVDWKSRNARVQFDEDLLPAQKLAEMIADTPHMMGGNMRYGGWLALKVHNLIDDATAKQVKEALSDLAGVERVVAYPERHSVAIAFGAQGDLTSGQLIDALDGAGIKAENY